MERSYKSLAYSHPSKVLLVLNAIFYISEELLYFSNVYLLL